MAVKICCHTYHYELSWIYDACSSDLSLAFCFAGSRETCSLLKGNDCLYTLKVWAADLNHCLEDISKDLALLAAKGIWQSSLVLASRQGRWCCASKLKLLVFFFLNSCFECLRASSLESRHQMTVISVANTLFLLTSFSSQSNLVPFGSHSQAYFHHFL